MRRNIAISLITICVIVLWIALMRAIPGLVQPLIGADAKGIIAGSTPSPEYTNDSAIIEQIRARNAICDSDKTDVQRNNALATPRAHMHDKTVTLYGRIADVRGRPQAYVAIIDANGIDYSFLVEIPDALTLTLNKGDNVQVNGALDIDCRFYGQIHGTLTRLN